MSSVRLDFIPPQEQGIVSLEIWESPVKDGTYTKIEDVADVGSVPDVHHLLHDRQCDSWELLVPNSLARLRGSVQ